jgi:hypothetical protein
MSSYDEDRLQEDESWSRLTYDAAQAALRDAERTHTSHAKVFDNARYFHDRLHQDSCEEGRRQFDTDREVAGWYLSAIRERMMEGTNRLRRLELEAMEAKRAWERAHSRWKHFQRVNDWAKNQGSSKSQPEKERKEGKQSFSRDRASPPRDSSRARPRSPPRSKSSPRQRSPPRPRTPPPEQSRQDDGKPKSSKKKTYTPPPPPRGSPFASHPNKREGGNDRKPTSKQIDAFFIRTDEALADVANMKSFPFPPAWPCHNGCEMKKFQRSLDACSCNIAYIFRNRDLKAMRLKFHPDRYSAVNPEVRERVQTWAKEIFVVLDGLYSSSK